MPKWILVVISAIVPLVTMAMSLALYFCFLKGRKRSQMLSSLPIRNAILESTSRDEIFHVIWQ
jgi:hypothetical protein